jgi:KDO2-lipid IV(A) lauroyltransferase
LIGLSKYLRWSRYYLLFKACSFFPLALAYKSAGLISRFDRQLNKAAYKSVAAGLKQIFPAQAKDPATLNTWIALYFRMMARETMDVFCMSRASHTIPPVVSLSQNSLNILHNAKSNGTGVILAMAHFGRLNMVLFGLALSGESLGMLTMITDKRNTDLDSVSRRYINQKINTLLRFTGGPWLTLGDDFRKLYKSLNDGATMVILFDAYSPEHSRNKMEVPFLGGLLQVSRGIEKLAKKTGATIIYGVAKEDGWRINAELYALPADPTAALRAAVAQLERDVLETPWQWWHWNILDYIWMPPRV